MSNITPSSLDVVESFGLNFLLGNAVTLICLHEDREGRKDLEEALACLDREIKKQEQTGESVQRKTELDNVNPSHYKTSAGFQVIDVIEAYNLNFPLGNAIKYICRHGSKNGLEDLKKARWYLDRELTGGVRCSGS